MFKNDIKNRLIKAVLIILIIQIIVINPYTINVALGSSYNNQIEINIELKDFEGFVDDFFNEKMKEHRVPGAAFILVKDGEVFFSKGYGYADIEKAIPVTVDQTLFRIA